MENSNVQQELFVLPIGLKEIARLDGMPLYSSDKLKEKFIKSLSKISMTRPVSRHIETMVEENKINPCFLNKGILRLTAFKIFAPAGSKSIMGFYYPEVNKIFMLLDNNITFGFASNVFMAKLTLHEAMHMFATNRKSQFLRLFKPELSSYYYELFNEIFKLNDAKVDVFDIVEYIFKEFESNLERISNAKLANYYKTLQDKLTPHTSLKKDQFDKIATDYILVIKLYLKSLDAFLGMQRRYRHILTPLYNAYGKAFGGSQLSTICIQELIIPSEVICILSEVKLNSKIYRAFKAI